MDTIKIYIGHPNQSTINDLKALVEALDHEVVGITDSAKQMLDDCIRLDPKLIISGVEFDDGDGIEALIKISEGQPKPSIVVAQTSDLDKVERAMDDHVMAYLIDPVTKDDLRPTIYVVLRRFEQFEDLKEENENLRDALEVRKVVERAKGILMRQNDISEEDAYLKLRSLSTSKRMKMKDVAQMVVDLHG